MCLLVWVCVLRGAKGPRNTNDWSLDEPSDQTVGADGRGGLFLPELTAKFGPIGVYMTKYLPFSSRLWVEEGVSHSVIIFPFLSVPSFAYFSGGPVGFET